MLQPLVIMLKLIQKQKEVSLQVPIHKLVLYIHKQILNQSTLVVKSTALQGQQIQIHLFFLLVQVTLSEIGMDAEAMVQAIIQILMSDGRLIATTFAKFKTQQQVAYQVTQPMQSTVLNFMQLYKQSMRLQAMFGK